MPEFQPELNLTPLRIMYLPRHDFGLMLFQCVVMHEFWIFGMFLFVFGFICLIRIMYRAAI
jgi:hypothetical protein